jgi:hypothetical protein
MSVILKSYTEINSLYNALSGDDEFVDFIQKTPIGKPGQSSYPPGLDSFGRLMWYLYVANGTAYSLQYQEEIQIFSKEVAADKYKPMAFDDAAAGYGSLIYNIFTNDGNYFLGEPWYSYAEKINEFLQPAQDRYFNRNDRY